MKKALLKVLLIIVGIHLAACSFTKSKHVTVSDATPSSPVVADASTTTTKSTTPAAKPTDQNTLQELNLSPEQTNTALIGGSVEKSMDQNDKIKMSRALDKAPGKSTNWTNERTRISYTVTPIKKVVIKENPYCREYETQITRGSHSEQVNGTACIAADGGWHTIK